MPTPLDIPLAPARSTAGWTPTAQRPIAELSLNTLHISADAEAAFSSVHDQGSLVDLPHGLLHGVMLILNVFSINLLHFTSVHDNFQIRFYKFMLQGVWLIFHTVFFME